MRTVLLVTLVVLLASAMASAVDYKQSTLHFSNVPEIDSISFKSAFYGAKSAVDRPTTGGEPAYDYSVHIIKDGAVYRMYAGGRWKRPGIDHADGDHVMQYVSTTGAEGTRSMPHDRPEFWNGAEDGKLGVWCSNNCLEPEVVKVKDKYYLYTQVEIDGSKDNADNKNCYFLGISTIDVTGELEYLSNSTFRAIYGATTANAPGGAAIWSSEIGVGELIFTISPSAIE